VAARQVAQMIVLELDVEQPVHALDAPVTTRSVNEPVDIERADEPRRSRERTRLRPNLVEPLSAA
jgi:hypothetical protein